MPECVGNYSITTANGITEGADTLAGERNIEPLKYLRTVNPR
jgi:hypothetical protein